MINKGRNYIKDSKKGKKFICMIYLLSIRIKKYSVLNSEGEVVTTSKKAINYAGIYHDSFITVAYKDKNCTF